MGAAASRSRLHTLRLERQAAALGRELLDDKREAILRALLDRSRRRASAAADVAAIQARAVRALQHARIELGARAVERAVLAQPGVAAIEWRHGSVVGVATPRLEGRIPPFAPRYGPAGTAADLDRAGVEYSSLASAFVRFAEEDEAVRNLQSGLVRTVRRLKALEEVVMPRLDREFRDVTVALEEDERDDTVRRQAGGSRRTSWPGRPNERP
jgi:V/A-type H+-transporting ATPase subunit D